jgi:hypothetical protein
MYAPGFMDENGFSTEKMYDLTGIRIAYKPSRYYPYPSIGGPLHVYLTNFDSPITQNLPANTIFGTDNRIGPFFYCDDPEAIVLGNLFSPHLGVFPEMPGFCAKQFDDWRSVFVGVPHVPTNVLRNIAKAAGVHIYSELDDLVYANNDFLAIHTNRAGPREIKLRKATDVVDVFTGEIIAKNTNKFLVELRQYETVLYHLG